VPVTTNATTTIAANRTPIAISTVPRPIGDCAAAGAVAGATVCTTAADEVASDVSALLDAVDDGEVEVVLSAGWLPAVAGLDVVDVGSETVVDDPMDDDTADEPAVDPDALCELDAVDPVTVAAEPDCSGAASAERADGPVASAVESTNRITAVAARTVSIASAAATTAPGRAVRRTLATAIEASEQCRRAQFAIGRSGISIRLAVPPSRSDPDHPASRSATEIGRQPAR